MAYEFTKLSEVTLVETTTEPNLLIEDGGEIVRVPASCVVTSSSGSSNEGNSTGGNANALIYTRSSSLDGANSFTDNEGNYKTVADIYNDYASGKIIRLKGTNMSSGRDEYSDILAMSYGGASNYYIHIIADGQLSTLSPVTVN